MTFKATADFSDILKQANAVGKQSGKLFSDNFNLAQGGMFAKSLARFKDIQKRVEKDGKDAAARIEIHKLGLAKKTHAEELKLEREAKVLKAKVAAELDKDAKKALGQQYAAKLKELKLVQSYNKDTAKFIRDMNKSVSAVQSIANITNREIKQLERATKTLKSVSEWVEENLRSGSEKFGENLTEAAEGLGDAFTSGIDVTALSKKLSAGLGRGLSKAGDLMGAAGGGLGARGLGAVVGGIGASVAALGALVAAFIMLDKKVKEFNKDIIKTHGALSVMRLGAGDLNRGLTIVKRTVMDLTGNFGVSEDEAKQLFASLDNGNITLARLTGGVTDADIAQRRLNLALRDTYTAANMTGVSLSEYADNLTNYVNDLGMSTETVNDNFRSIAKMASESGFSTRRFYSMVVQATSGQSALNVSLEHTGDLLLRMSKIMGMKKAAEMVGGAAGGMGQMGAQERLKTLLIAGGRGEKIFQRQAVQSAKDFTQSNRGLSGAFTAALDRAGLTGRGIETAFSNSDPTRLVQSLGQLSAVDQRKMLTELRESGVAGTAEMARQLEEITNLSRGGLGSRVGAAGGLGAGANLQMQAALLRRFMDPTGRLGARERVAAESVTGMGGPQMDAFLSQMQAMQGDFERMQAGGETGEKLLKEYRLSRNAQGQLVDSIGHVIRSSDDLFMTQRAQDAHEQARTMDEATSIAYQTMDATTSVADILENKIAQYIQRVYEWLNGFLGPMLSRWMGSAGAEFEKKQATLSFFDKAISELQKQSEGERTRLARLSTTASSSAASPEERERARSEIQRIRQGQTGRDQQIQALREASQRVREGNTYDIREGYRVTGAHRVREQPIGMMGARAAEFDTGMESLPDKIFKTWKEAQDYVKQYGGTASEARLSNEEAIRRITGAAVAPGTAGTAAPATAAPATAPAPPPPTPAHAEAATAPVVAATESAQTQAQQQHQQDRRDTKQRDRQLQVFNEKLLKGKDLGDGLAMSRLPDAIAEADAKMRLLEGIYEKGPASMSPEVINRLLSGTGTEEDIASAGMGGAAARALRFRHASQEAPVHDFISQDRGGRTVITPINREDQVMGMKPGGPIANSGGRPGGNVNIAIHGGDERRVFNVVRRAIQQAGITPNRVPGG